MGNINNNIITVFEHQALYTYKGDVKINEQLLYALQALYGEKGVPYFSLLHKGVQFCEYVGVIQVGNITIEVLPKADKCNDVQDWRSVLIGMLKAVGLFDIHTPSSSNLKLKSNSLLELYFELFITEAEQLLHKGLVKRYNKVEGNRTSLKGSIQFNKHIQHNITHRERFYVKHSTYSCEHPLNSVIYKTIKLLKAINTNSVLSSRIGKLLLDYPEMPNIKADNLFFEKIIYNRRTEGYKKAIDIARLLLLNYHPDVSRGKNHVLALMFDMNLLWEQFVYVSIRKLKSQETTVFAQSPKEFWKSHFGYKQRMKPDIVINKNKQNCVVLDTKWKNLFDNNPSPEDLRQLYAYSKFHNNAKSALVYPGNSNGYIGGNFLDGDSINASLGECGIYFLRVNPNIKIWQQEIKTVLLG